MTISTTSSGVTYGGNGLSTVFTFPFVGVSSADLEIVFTSTAGIITVLNPSTYSVVINPTPSGGLWGVGGSVTYPLIGSPIAVGTTLSINRMVPYTQDVSIGNQTNFYPQSVEQGLDLLELQLQQLVTNDDYALRAPLSDLYPPNTIPSIAQRAGGYLAFDSAGQPVVLFNTPTPTNPTTVNPRVVQVTTTQTIGFLLTDSFGGLSVYQSGSAVTTLQLPTTGGPYPVFDGSLNSGTFPITVLPPISKTILGRGYFILNFNGSSATFCIDNNEVVIQ